jgi:hypothetical protein
MRSQLLVFALSVFALGASSCRKAVLRGEGPITSETRHVGTFSKVDASGSQNITIVKDTDYKVIVTGYNNLLPIFETKVRDNRLFLEYKPGYWNVRNDNIAIEVHTPYVDKIKLSGSGNVNMGNGFEQDNFEADLSGSGDIYVGANRFKKLTADVNGSGSINTEAADADNVYAKISGSGNINVYVSTFLHVRISGSGDVTYKGNPENTDISITGSGKVKKRS